MSAQFGRINFSGKPVDPKDLDQVRPVLASYGPDGEGYICKDNLGILYRAFHTTKESRREEQPCVSKFGTVITWDGRLDNREELIGLLRGDLSVDSTDLSIVAAAYERWTTDSFAKLIGDWALSIWEPRSKSLILAKDFVGSRHLYYFIKNGEVVWCTVLDPLVLFGGRSFVLDEEYIAGWLSIFPAGHLTPYAGIHSVPPSSFVLLQRGARSVKKYWDLDPGKRIRFRADREYEECFRSVFSQAVRRRLRSDSPVLAELSGGMDSSSIVCMGDAIIAEANAESPRLDTVSHYDDSEPNWNERPYFTQIEALRGRAGCHVDIGMLNSFRVGFDTDRFAAIPSSAGGCSEVDRQFAECVRAGGNRVVLSGIGGDEFAGGVPSPVPELADLLARAEFGTLVHQLKRWALDKRMPWFHLFWQAAREFLPGALVSGAKESRPIPWLRTEFVQRFRSALNPYQNRLSLFGPLPSFQQNLKALDLLRGQLSCYPSASEPVCEKRYPYLDRNFIECLVSVPREQLVRPGQRRSLMRRALVGIVPNEILNRKRKAFIARGPLAAISGEWQNLLDLSRSMRTEWLGIIDSQQFLDALKAAARGHQVPLVPLLRTISTELWLRNLEKWGCVHTAPSSTTVAAPRIVGERNQARAAVPSEYQALS